ncbi:MAG: pentapeptide repeat-containing protein, partial [Deltaproteobacteria bacterium]
DLYIENSEIYNLLVDNNNISMGTFHFLDTRDSNVSLRNIKNGSLKIEGVHDDSWLIENAELELLKISNSTFKRLRLINVKSENLALKNISGFVEFDERSSRLCPSGTINSCISNGWRFTPTIEQEYYYLYDEESGLCMDDDGFIGWNTFEEGECTVVSGAVDTKPIQTKNYIAANLKKAVFSKLESQMKSSYEKSNFISSDFSDQDIDILKFQTTKLNRSNFNSTNIDEIIFEESSLEEAIFNEANIRKLILNKVDAKRTSWINTKVRSGHVYSADLNDSNLENAEWEIELNGILNLKGANLRYSKITILFANGLSRLDLSYADLRGADLRGLNLSKNQILTEGARVDHETLLPSHWGTSSP